MNVQVFKDIKISFITILKIYYEAITKEARRTIKTRTIKVAKIAAY